jgi:hypothetical protein
MSSDIKIGSSNLTPKDKYSLFKEITPTKEIVREVKEKENKILKERCPEYVEELNKLVSKDEQLFLDIAKYKKNKVCCIVGFAPSWNEAPYERKDVDFWGLNELYGYLNTLPEKPDFNLWFEVHDIKNSPSKQKQYHQDFLKTTNIPVVTKTHYDEYPTTIPYPVDYIIDKVKEGFIIKENTTAFEDYSNSISWMIALAIYMGYEEIYVYGVDMAQETEYFFQRSSCNFFMGLAIGKGIKLLIPASCRLCAGSGNLYGFRSDNAGRFRTKKKIEAQEETIVRVHQRNLELKFYQDRANKEFSDNTLKADLDVKMIEQELNQAKTAKVVAQNLLRCFADMPTDFNEINKQKPGLVNRYQIEVENASRKIEELKKELKQIQDKQFRRERDNYVANGVYNDEMEINKNQINMLKGHVAENNDLLNKNLV